MIRHKVSLKDLNPPNGLSLTDMIIFESPPSQHPSNPVYKGAALLPHRSVSRSVVAGICSTTLR
jgi:hypothetical protein